MKIHMEDKQLTRILERESEGQEYACKTCWQSRENGDPCAACYNMRRISDLREVKARYSWHPYPQEKPNDGTAWYLVSFTDESGVRVVRARPYNFGLGFDGVEAWRELPEAYKGEDK